MFISKLIRYLHDWRQSYQAVRKLSQLNDREFADLGLIRSDISRVANVSSRRKMSNDPGPHRRHKAVEQKLVL
jgi:uncharacterized protein YjiS (DUF1127 family)